MADLRQLDYFVAAFEERNVTGAARRRHVSQPSVSAAIAALEEELGTPLFVRHRKGAQPTAAAEQLYPIARRLVDETMALGSLFRTPRETRPLRLGLMRSLDAARVVEAIEALAPGTQLRLVDAEERCDARIISRALLKPNEAFVPLWRERYVIALPQSHPLALRATLDVRDLAG